MSKAAIIIGGIIAFLVLCFFCATCHAPAINQAAAPLADPSLWASLNNGKVELNGTVRTETIKQEIAAAAKNVYGEANVIDNQKVSTLVGQPSWLAAVPGMFGLMKDGVKGWGFGIDKGSLTVKGIVKNAELESKLLAGIKSAAPALRIVDEVDVEAAAVQRNINQYLEGKTIEFRTGSPEILPRGKAILDTVAMLLSEATEAVIEVGGHTDSQGDDASNMALSQRRADATTAYLVGKGIDKTRLTPVGYGETEPIDDNATAEGRQRNRRIQFTLK